MVNIDLKRYKLSKTLYIKWVIKNHTCHHKIKGDKKGNYNITLPGGDSIFNSYNSSQSLKLHCM